MPDDIKQADKEAEKQDDAARVAETKAADAHTVAAAEHQKLSEKQADKSKS